MEPDYATLPKGQNPKPLEEWPAHKDCKTASREHKYRWEYLGEGQTSATNAVCVHCGKRVKLTRKAVTDADPLGPE